MPSFWAKCDIVTPPTEKWAFFRTFSRAPHQGPTLEKFCWRIIRVGLCPFIICTIGYYPWRGLGNHDLREEKEKDEKRESIHYQNIRRTPTRRRRIMMNMNMHYANDMQMSRQTESQVHSRVHEFNQNLSPASNVFAEQIEHCQGAGSGTRPTSLPATPQLMDSATLSAHF